MRLEFFVLALTKIINTNGYDSGIVVIVGLVTWCVKLQLKLND